MVFFTCNSCGESLKKNVVEKHRYKCNLSQGLCCMDCHKLFREDYATHLNCITEDQKYGSCGFVPKVMKGKVKQEQWINNIQIYLQNTNDVDSDVKSLLMLISQQPNVPRKQKPFMNFMRSIKKGISDMFINKVWNILRSISSTTQKPPEKPLQSVHMNRENNKVAQSKVERGNEYELNSTEKNNLSEETQRKSKKRLLSVEESSDLSCVAHEGINTYENLKKKKKRTNDLNSMESLSQMQSEEILSNNEQINHSVPNELPINDIKFTKRNNDPSHVSSKDLNSPGEFKWKSTLKNLIRESSNGKIKIKKLQKIVVIQYLAAQGLEGAQHESSASTLFNSKIQNEKFLIEGKYIRLK